jgi:hypothetical protein
MVAAWLAQWTVTGVVFYLARLVNRSNKQSCSCRVSGCKTYGDVGSCDNCAKLYCYECPHDRGGRSCDGCSKDLCVDCVHDGQNRLINFCEGCMTRYCLECRNVTVCALCGDPMCDKCVAVNIPDCCGLLFCKECENLFVEKCRICEKTRLYAAFAWKRFDIARFAKRCSATSVLKWSNAALAQKIFVPFVVRATFSPAAMNFTASSVPWKAVKKGEN